MPTGSRHLLAALKTRWDAKGMDTEFSSLWSAASSRHHPLQDTLARPGTPFPYCVFEQDDGEVVERHSGKQSTTEMVIRRTMVQFRVHSKTKTQAADLADKIMDAFYNAPLTFGSGDDIEVLFNTDFCIRDGDSEWQWVVRFDVAYESEEVLSPG